MQANLNGITVNRNPIPMNTQLLEEPAEWSEIITLTPEKAAQWLEEFTFNGQRKVNDTHVTFLAEEILAHRFRTSEMRLIHTSRGTALTNGQHRLRAVIRANTPIRVNVYHCSGGVDTDSEDYQACDIGRQRTMQERFNAGRLEWRNTLTARQFNELSAAVAPIIGGFTPQSFSGNHPKARSLGARAEAMEYWLPAAHKLFKLAFGVGDAGDFVTGRRAVLSIAVITLHYQSDTATEFWGGLLNDDGLKKGDPRKTLLDFLRSNKAQSITNHVYPRYVCAAWNSWYREEKNQQLKVYDATKPILIMGTPYKGKAIVEMNYTKS